jgi:serine/threonine protein kinase
VHDKQQNDNSVNKLAEPEQQAQTSSEIVSENSDSAKMSTAESLRLSFSANDELQGTDASNLNAALIKANDLEALGYSKEEILNALFGRDNDRTQTEIDPDRSRVVHNQLKGTSQAEQNPQILDQLGFKGKRFSKYEVLDLIGKGGMSSVYRTRNLETERIVACKVLLPRLLDDKKNRRRFEHEAEAAQRLTHNNIINVHDFGETDGQPFMIMDYLDGISLSELIESNGKLPIRRALPIFIQICDALSFAHKRDIVHRDLKPSNIMLSGEESSSDFAKVVDFGIAKIIKEHTEESTKLTKTGEIFGSPLYMSPEQCMGQAVDRRSDIYSFGILMYEVLKGKPPLEGPDPLSTMFKQMNDQPEDLGKIDHDTRLVQIMENIIFKCMNKNPAARYQNMESLKVDLERAITIGDNGSDTLAKFSRLVSGLQRSAKHELTSAAKSQRKLLLLTTSSSLILLPIVIIIILLWPLRYAWGTLPTSAERRLYLRPVVLEPEKAGSLPRVDPTNLNSKFSLGSLKDLVDIADLEPCLTKGKQYLKAGLYKEAIPFYRAAQTICLKNKMEDSPEIFQSNSDWAECLERLHVYSPARALATEALGRLSNTGKGDNADALLVSGKIAYSYDAEGRTDDALQSYGEFLGRLTPLNVAKCKNPEELAYDVSNAGKFYQYRNDSKTAIRLLTVAQSLWQQISQQMPTNATVTYNCAVTENDLGLVNQSNKNYPLAHTEFRNSIMNIVKAEGENTLDWAKVQFNDSDALWNLGKYYASLEQRSSANKVWSSHYQVNSD